MGDERIEVLPDIKILGRNVKKQERKVDPDVQRVKDKEEEVNVFKGGQSTKEEESEKENKTSDKTSTSSSWLIIGLSLVVVILIVIVVWYVLKENKESAEKSVDKLPPGVLHPSHLPPNNNPRMDPRAYVNPNTHVMRQYVQPGQGPIRQTEKMPVQTKPMNKNQPTKKELEQTLRDLYSIKEEPDEKKIKPSKKQKQNENKSETKDDGTDPETEDRLAQTFYNDLNQMDENDSGDELIDENTSEGENPDEND